MGAENLGNFTQNASDSSIEVGYCQINLTNALNKRLYRDMGAGHFGGNFTHLVRGRIDAGSKMFSPWLLSNLADGSYDDHIETTGALDTVNLSLRSDTHTINGQLGYQLGTSQSGSAAQFAIYDEEEEGGTWAWKSDIYIRHSGGTETQIGTDVAPVSRSEVGSGLQSNTWTIDSGHPLYDAGAGGIPLDEGDAIKIVEKIYRDDELMDSRFFITSALGSTVLAPATWTIYRYTALTESGVQGELWHGNATYNSRVEGVKHGDPIQLVNSFLNVRFDSTDGYRIILEEGIADSIIETDEFAGEQGKIYYLEIERDEGVGTFGTLYCRIYDDEARTNLVDTLSLTLRANQDLRYVYALNTYESGTSATGMATGLSLDGTESYGAGVVANTSKEHALPYPMQQGVFYDGMHHNVIFAGDGPGGAVIPPSVAFGLDEDLLFGLPNLMTGMKGAHGNGCSSFFSYESYGAWISVVVDPVNGNYGVGGFAKDDNALSETQRVASVSISDVKREPTTVISRDQSVWIAGKDATLSSGPGNIIVQQAAERDFGFSQGFDEPVIMGAVSGVGTSQLVYYSAGDIGCLWTDGTSLYYKHWDAETETWGGDPETVATGLKTGFSYRGVTTRDGNLFVLYREGSSNKLRYVIRTSGWSSPATMDDDTELNSNTGFTVCADVGRPDSAYIIYFDTSSDIVYRVWDGTSIGDKTTLVDSPSLMLTAGAHPYLAAPFYDSERIPVVYHLANGDIKVSVIELPTPEPGGTGGTLVSQRGHRQLSVNSRDNMASYGTRSLLFYYGRDHRGWGRLYDHQTESWETGEVQLTRKRYWDQHNAIKAFLDGDGYVYIFEGGRTMVNSVEYIKARRSNYPLSHANFTLDLENDWTDVSPPEEPDTTGRGYKEILVDQDGVIYLITMTSGIEMIIRERRGGEWSTPQTIVSIIQQGAPYSSFLYIGGVKLGRETVGQKSILLGWSIKYHEDGQLEGIGNIYRIEFSYLRLVPQGDGTYKAYRADGVEMTLPCGDYSKDMILSTEDFDDWAGETVYAENDIIVPNPANGHCYRCKVAGTSGGSSPTWPTDHFATVEDGTVTWEEWGFHGPTEERFRVFDTDSLDVDTPCGTYATALPEVDPNELVSGTFYKWGSGHWEFYDMGEDFKGPPMRLVLGGEGLFTALEKEYDGVDEIVTTYSTDDGETWNAPSRLTTSGYDCQVPMLSPRSSTVQNVIFSRRLHLAYSEVYFSEVQITQTKPASYYFTLMQGGL